MAFSKMIFVLSPTPTLPASWNFWTASDSFELISQDGYDLYKTNKRIAYYGVIKNGNGYNPVLLSPNADATTFSIYNENTGVSTSYTYNSTLTDPANITWYVNCHTDAFLYFSSDPEYTAPTVQDILNRIFAIPFHDTYEVGQTYSISLTDNEKAVRKSLGVFLFKNVNRTEDAYLVLSDNADAIISRLIGNIGSGDRMVDIDINPSWNGSRTYITFAVGWSSTMANTFTVNSHYTSGGFEYNSVSLDSTIQFTKEQAYVSRSGVSYSTYSANIQNTTVGINPVRGSSNIGIDL